MGGSVPDAIPCPDAWEINMRRVRRWWRRGCALAATASVGTDRLEGLPIVRVALPIAMLLAVVSGCSPDRVEAIRRLAPALSSEFASHVVLDDSVAFRRFIATAGYDRATESLSRMWRALPTSSPEVFSAVDSILGPYIDKTKWAIAKEFGAEGLWITQVALRRRSREEQRDIVRLSHQPVEIEAEKKMKAGARLQLYDDLFEACHKYGDAADTGPACGRRGELLFGLERSAEAMRALELGVRSSLRCGEVGMACQLLGTRAIHFGHLGELDSAWASIETGLRIARRVRSKHEARLLRFWSSFLRVHQNRSLLALDLLDQSTAAARRVGSKEQEAWSAVETTKLFGDLSCWDLATTEIRRAEGIAQSRREEFWQEGPGGFLDHLLPWQALCRLESGEQAPAFRAACRLVVRTHAITRGPAREQCAAVAAALFDNLGEHATALQVLEESRTRCIRKGSSTPQGLRTVIAGIASAKLHMGDFVGCAQAVWDYQSLPDSIPDVDPWSHTYVCVASIGATRALLGQSAAVDTARAALRRFRDRTRDVTIGPEVDMVAAVADLLHRSVLELLDSDPEAGYAFEMAWREALALPALRDSSLATSIPLRPNERSQDVRLVVDALGAMHGMHCLYSAQGARVVRWTVYEGQVRREFLLKSAAALQADVDALMADIHSTNSKKGLTATALHEKSVHLARLLLPEALLNGAAPARLFITSERTLYRVPFGLLNVASEGFVPLVQRCDVASVRYWRDSGPFTAARTALLVTNPEYGARTRRAYSSLNDALPEGVREATDFAALIPTSTVLRGVHANKASVLAAMIQAECLYFATHMIQHPRLPFVFFIPLADTSSTSLANAYLEPADVRSADLSRCQMAVLSGCSSALPYVANRAVSPSLGDAFLDGGARSVLQTLWDVADADAAAVMGPFANEYRRTPTDPVGALGRAQRQLAARGVSPAVWGAYSVAVAGVARP